MKCIKDDEWVIRVPLVEKAKEVAYRYATKELNGTFQFELNGIRKLKIPENTKKIEFLDFWFKPNGDSPFSTIAFTDVFFKRKRRRAVKPNTGDNFILQLRCPQIEPERHFAVIGNQDVLGNWDVAKKVRLDESNFPIWSISLNTKDIKFPIEYKYLIVDTKTDEVLAWDDSPNRHVEKADAGNLTIVTEANFVRTIPSWKTAGVAIPVFSLRSEESFGTGDFMDLKKMVDWAKLTGQNFIKFFRLMIRFFIILTTIPILIMQFRSMHCTRTICDWKRWVFLPKRVI